MRNKKRWILILTIALLALFVLSLYFDPLISKWFESSRGFYLSKFFLGINFLNSEIAIAILLTFLLLWSKKKREWVLPLWVTMAITAIVAVILKISVHRPRPFAAGVVSLLPGIAAKASYFTWDLSFPSFDSAFIFCTLPLVSKFFPKLKYPWAVFAVLIALSRVFVGVHYMSDVIAGSIIGYGVGIFVVWLESKNNFFEKMYNKIAKKK